MQANALACGMGSVSQALRRAPTSSSRGAPLLSLPRRTACAATAAQGAVMATCSAPRAAMVSSIRSLPCCGGSGLRGAAVLPARQQAARAAGRRQVAVHAMRSEPDIPDRAVAAICFLLPMLDGLRFGKFFLVQFPQVAQLLVPLDPIIRLYYTFPFAGLIVFFALYLGVINNPNFSRYVRFNGMQAVLLDIILILPGLLESVFKVPMGGPGLQLYITLQNTIFLFLLACVAYGAGSCIVGQTPRLPLVADAADAQIR